jgi:hypothetical protein
MEERYLYNIIINIQIYYYEIPPVRPFVRPFLFLLETGDITNVVCTAKKRNCYADREEPAPPTYVLFTFKNVEGRPMCHSLTYEYLWKKNAKSRVWW